VRAMACSWHHRACTHCRVEEIGELGNALFLMSDQPRSN